MAFNIKINAYVNSVVVENLLNESNCSSIVLEKKEILNEDALTNGVLVNDLYRIKCTTKLTSGNKTIDVRKTYFSGSEIYFLSKIYAYDSSTNDAIKPIENLFGKDYKEFTLNKNIELRFIYESKIPVCVTVVNKYYGDPFILCGNEYDYTEKVKEISIGGNCEKFWVCENKVSYEAVDFTKWEINIHKVEFNGSNATDNVLNTEYVNKGDSKLLNLATVAFDTDVDNGDIDLYLVRNENVLSLNNLKKLDIYTTFTNYIANINSNSIGYYLELKAYYTPKDVNITIWRRNGTPLDLMVYRFGNNIGDSAIQVPGRGGYVFDGYYINPKVGSNDLDEVPADNATLDSNHVRVTDSTGKFVQYATNFLDDYYYINPVDYKYVKANYRPKITTITLDWQTSKKNNETLEINFKQNLSNVKTSAIPTVTEKQNGVDVELKFMGFYTQKDGKGDKVIKEDGKFRTDLIGYTSANCWKWNKHLTADDSMTLYAFWKSGSYIELNKVGGTGGSNSFTVKYKENMSNHDLYMPTRYVDPSDTTSDKLIFNGYWVDDYKTRVTRDDGAFKLNVTKKDGTKLTNGLRQWLLEEPIELFAYWYSENYMVYANSNLDNCTAKVDGKNKVKKKVNETVNLTISYDSKRYNFNGWKVNDETDIFSTEKTANKTISLSDVNSAESRIDYNANFEHRRYTIYYKDIDNTQYGIHTFYYDSFCRSLLKPQKAGYKFVGWFADKTLKTQVSYINEGNGGGTDVNNTYLTSNGTIQEIILYAKWEKITLQGTFILRPGIGKWKSGVIPPVTGTKVTYGNTMPSVNENLIPELDEYTFIGFFDKDNYRVINKECTDWVKNTYYVDENGNSKMTDTHIFTAKFSKNINFSSGLNVFTKKLNCNITAHTNIDFKNSIENKIATIDWINTTIGMPEINDYEDSIENFYNSGMAETYNSNKGLADKYFFNDFAIDNNKLLKQSAIIDFFDNSATKIENNFYLKEINYDVENNKTIMRVNFIEKITPLYPTGYEGPTDTLIYFTINDDKSIVYKMSIDEINLSLKYETFLKYFDVEFPYLTPNINKITIEHISCFAIDNLDNTRTYYKPYITFNMFKDLDLTIEKNTILNNMEIKEYESDQLVIQIPPGLEVVQ